MKRIVTAAALAAALLVPAVPALADGRPGAGVEDCRDWGGGYYGVWAWYYDADGDYHRIWTCIYTGP